MCPACGVRNAAVVFEPPTNCRRLVTEYSATKGRLGFDPKKLHEMVNGCAHRQELLRDGLKAAEVKVLRHLIGRERLDLWS
jgi:hypothetical protein